MTIPLSTPNAPIRAADALRSPSLADQERRGRTVSFLTWAFLLSEAFKGTEAFGGAAQAAESPNTSPSSATSDTTVPPPLAGDEPALRDWSFSFPGDGTIPGPVAHTYVPPLAAGQFDNLSLGEVATPRPQPGAGAHGDHNPDLTHADPHGGTQGTNVDIGIGIKLDLLGLHADVGLAVGADGLLLPLLAEVGDWRGGILRGDNWGEVAVCAFGLGGAR